MNPLLLTAAMIPGLVISIWIYRQDRHEKEPRLLLLASFFWGCVSTVPAGWFQGFFKGMEHTNSLLSVGIFSFFIVAFSEELSKFIFLRFHAYKKDAFNEPMDGIVYAVMVAMGFATIENVLYSFGNHGGYSTALARALTAVPAHASFAVLMGAYVGLAKFVPEKRNAYMVLGVGLAVLFHGLYDFFLIQKSFAGLGFLSIVTLVVGITLSRKLIKIGQDISPFKNFGNTPETIESEDKMRENDLI